MATEEVFTRARIVMADEVVRGSVLVRDGSIAALDEDTSGVPGTIDLAGDFLMPGLVELHTDNLERHLLPRPGVAWPAVPALLQHDAEIAAAGITTVYDALCVGSSDLCGLRGRDLAELLDAIKHARAAAMLRADHRVHVRCEVPSGDAVPLFAPFEDHPLVGLMSLMDHTPGERQWRDLRAARNRHAARNGEQGRNFQMLLADAVIERNRHAFANRRFFAEYARARGIPLASHDDATPEHVIEAQQDGATVAEFPTTVTAARAARDRGLNVVMGAPNIVRGGSHAGNVSALALAGERLLNVLSSDYVPGSLLPAAFRLTADAGHSIAEAIATVTRAPAHALGLRDRGEIALGKRADLLRVRLAGDYGSAHPVVVSVWRAGRRII
jgi:alpha-D-ribose 1-methylphosphonate 5-triphosphate diphosphatase